MVAQEAVELAAHRAEPAGLDLDQQILAADVDDEPAELDLQLVGVLDQQLLELGVEGALVEGADAGDGSTLEPGVGPLAEGPGHRVGEKVCRRDIH